jgi:hypothetical protein
MVLRISFASFLMVMLAAGRPAQGAEPTGSPGSGVLDMPLARRCELARLVALQAAEMITATRQSEAYLAGGHGGLLVWVGEPRGDLVHGDAEAEANKLIRATEACEPVLFPGPAGGMRIDIVGQGIPRATDGPAHCLAFVAEERDGLLAFVMRLNRPEQCAAPDSVPDSVTMTSGRAMLLSSLPELQIDVDARKKQFRVERAALTFIKVSGPVP